MNWYALTTPHMSIKRVLYLCGFLLVFSSCNANHQGIKLFKHNNLNTNPLANLESKSNTNEDDNKPPQSVNCEVNKENKKTFKFDHALYELKLLKQLDQSLDGMKKEAELIKNIDERNTAQRNAKFFKEENFRLIDGTLHRLQVEFQENILYEDSVEFSRITQEEGVEQSLKWIAIQKDRILQEAITLRKFQVDQLSHEGQDKITNRLNLLNLAAERFYTQKNLDNTIRYTEDILGIMPEHTEAIHLCWLGYKGLHDRLINYVGPTNSLACAQKCLNLACDFKKIKPDSSRAKLDQAISIKMLGDLESQWMEKRRIYGQCYSILHELDRNDPGNNLWQRELYDSCVKERSMMYYTNNLIVGRRDSRIKHFRENELLTRSLKIAQQQAERFPDDTEWQLNISNSLEDLAYDCLKTYRIQVEQSNQENNKFLYDKTNEQSFLRLNAKVDYSLIDKAINFYTQSIEIQQKLILSDPNNLILQDGLALSLIKLGNIYVEQNELSKSSELYTKSVEIREKLVQKEPHSLLWKSGLSVSYIHLGKLEEKQGKLEDASRHFKQDLEIFESLLLAYPENYNRYTHYSKQEKIGDLAEKLNNKSDAMKYYQLALDTLGKHMEQEKSKSSSDHYEHLEKKLKQ